MGNITHTTVRDAGDELHIEARFTDGQKYVIATIPPEHEDFAFWLSEQINNGKVPCFKSRTITWIKCSERMPPDDETDIILQNEKFITIRSGGVCRPFALMLKNWEWTPYDEETWRELNDGNS